MNPWYAQLTEAGPDWFLTIKVQEYQANQLGVLIHRLSLPGFSRISSQSSRGNSFAEAESSQHLVQYLDNHTAYRQANSDVTTNQWIYHSLGVRGPWFHLERGYGGYDSSDPGEMTQSENLAIRTVVRSAQLTIQSWSIGAGGEGYAHQILASGEQSETLAIHLGWGDA